MKLIAGNSNVALAREIADYLDIELADARISKFSDDETNVDIRENMRGEDVFILQSTCQPVNEHLMELLITVDALRRSSAKRITAVMPYYGYARQDRKSAPRTPITARLTADLLEKAGVNRVLTMDLHADQIQGFFTVPVDNLYALPILAKDIRSRLNVENMVVVSPDVGGVKRARALAKKLGCDLAIIDKRREKANQSEVMNIIGSVKGRECVMIDDMVDTAGTLVNAARALIDADALFVDAYTTHGVLSGPATERLNNNTDVLRSVTITDTIPYPGNEPNVTAAVNVRKVTVSTLLAKAIGRIANESSVSELFV